jgi:hypothetical protein
MSYSGGSGSCLRQSMWDLWLCSNSLFNNAFSLIQNIQRRVKGRKVKTKLKKDVKESCRGLI